MEIIYRYDPSRPAERKSPADAAEARPGLEEGNRTFVGLATGSPEGSRVVYFDLADVGVAADSGVPIQQPFTVIIVGVATYLGTIFRVAHTIPAVRGSLSEDNKHFDMQKCIITHRPERSGLLVIGSQLSGASRFVGAQTRNRPAETRGRVAPLARCLGDRVVRPVYSGTWGTPCIPNIMGSQGQAGR